MSTAFAAAIQQVIGDVYGLTGYQLRWKDADPALRQALPRTVVVQDHPLCMAIKQGGHYQRCVDWCSFDACASGKQGRCHAGLRQWRWALCDDAGELMGYACLGPFARGQGALPDPPPAARVEQIGRLIRGALQGLANARQRALGHMAQHHLHPCLQALIELLARDLGADAQAADCAALVHISPSRLQHLCREQLHLSLRQLRYHHLLQRAQRLLLDPRQHRIAHISDTLGFPDQRAFATWFRRLSGGWTATAWREQEQPV